MKNANEITITLEHMSMTHIRLLAQVSSEQSGFPIDPQIWAYLLGNLEKIEAQARKEGWEEAAAWANEYLQEGWEAAYDATGYLSIARLLDDAADDAKADDDNAFSAGAFDALAKAGAIFLADEFNIDSGAARYAIYRHYGVAY